MAIELEVRWLDSADIDYLPNWVPDAPEKVFFQVGITVGESGQDGASVFQAIIATPEGIASKASETPDFEFPDRNLIVLRRYSFSALQERIASIVAKCARHTWEDSAICLNRFFHWEHER